MSKLVIWKSFPIHCKWFCMYVFMFVCMYVFIMCPQMYPYCRHPFKNCIADLNFQVQIPILQTLKGSINIQKFSQPELQEDFLWLDKIQYPLGTCKTSSHLQKKCSFPYLWQKGHMAACGIYQHIKAHVDLHLSPELQFPVTHFKVLALLFFFPPINPPSSWASLSQNTHSLSNSGVFILLFSTSLPLSLPLCSFRVSLTLFSLFSSPCYIFFSLADSSGFPVYWTCSVCFFISLLCTLPDASGYFLYHIYNKIEINKERKREMEGERREGRKKKKRKTPKLFT